MSVPVRACGLAGAAALLTACTSSSGTPAPTSGSPTSSASSPAPSSTGPSIASLPVVPTLPAGVAHALPSLPTAFGTANPCAAASTAFTAASAYLGVAELGRADVAQRCVQGGSVPQTVTASLRATSVKGYFVPSGSTGGTTIVFRRIDGSQSVTITVTAAGQGFAITKATVA